MNHPLFVDKNHCFKHLTKPLFQDLQNEITLSLGQCVQLRGCWDNATTYIKQLYCYSKILWWHWRHYGTMINGTDLGKSSQKKEKPKFSTLLRAMCQKNNFRGLQKSIPVDEKQNNTTSSTASGFALFCFKVLSKSPVWKK